jgi:hypothetical protein
MSEIDVTVARWLVGSEGLGAVSRATRLLDDGVDELRVITGLRGSIDDPARTAAVLASATARRRARNRWLEADQLLFTRESLEQASDPTVAAWRAGRLADTDVYDLCSGVGGDAIAIARAAHTVTAVDLDAARLVLLEHNAAVYGLDIPTRVGDALDLEVPRDHLVHVDPARRRDGSRIGDPRRTQPPVDLLVTAHTAAPGRAIVLAPGTDADHPALGPDVEVEYLQLGDDLVEAVAWSGVLRSAGVTASATVLPRPATPGAGPDAGAVVPASTVYLQRVGERGPMLAVGPVASHVVEVVPAAIRARLHDEIGAGIGAHRVARRRALLTVGHLPPASPWYRARPVIDVLPARPAPIRRWLSASDHGPMELVLHGVSADPTAWWRQLGRPPRGPGGIRIELVRRDEDAIAIVTEDVAR